VEWIVERDGKALLQIAVTDSFLDWFLPQVRDPVVRRMDPYGDAVLDSDAQQRWLTELRRVLAEARAERTAWHQARSHLPRDPEARQRILTQLVDRDLAKEPRHGELFEVEALVALALDSGAAVRALGD
jgi:hypothetical protein